ncbi:DUF7115 domain-containing protein [Halapricum desulfuricans]|nr:hypothetical protein [Halapricum desulfuricans]
MELPELVREHLGNEDVQAGLALGDDDLLCLTPTRTLLYRADGLLSDERVTDYPHDVERLELSEGRRKTKFHFEYVDDEQSLTVPADATRDVLGLLLEGILRAERVLDAEEGVVEAFRFSELTLVVADDRIVKHVGNAVWDGEYESFEYEALTGIDFEQARVATEVVLSVDGRPKRIKTPNDEARLVERALERALNEYFEVTSLSQLQSRFQSEVDETDSAAARSNDEYPFDSEIRPLGDDPGSRADTDTVDGTGPSDTGSETEPVDAAMTPADLERIEAQLDELTAAVDKQNQLLRNHHTAIKQLVEELQSDR